MVTGGAGFYNGESAFAIGFTGTTGRVSYKMESAWASSGDTSYGAGFGYKF
ncbi:YadA-like family protein (plasmid) [Moraxella atlantae]